MIGEGEIMGADGEPEPAAEALAAAGIEPPVLGAKEGLALINGTDGILGMLVLALRRPRRPGEARRHRRGDAASRRCSGPIAPSPPTWWRCDRSPARRSAPPTCARSWPGRRSSPATARTTRASRTPTRCAARRRCTAPPATPIAHADRGRRGRARRSAIDNPMVLPDGRVESCGNFHGAPVGVRLRLPRDRRRRGRRDRRAPHRPPARRRPLARAAAVPRRRTRASTRG